MKPTILTKKDRYFLEGKPLIDEDIDQAERDLSDAQSRLRMLHFCKSLMMTIPDDHFYHHIEYIEHDAVTGMHITTMAGAKITLAPYGTTQELQINIGAYEFRIEQEDLLDTIKYINAGATSVSKEDGSGQ